MTWSLTNLPLTMNAVKLSTVHAHLDNNIVGIRDTALLLMFATVIVMQYIFALLWWNRKTSIFKNPINPRITTLRLLEGQGTCNIGIISFWQQCLAFIWAICQDHSKSKQKRKPTILCNCKHCKYTFKAWKRVFWWRWLIWKSIENTIETVSLFLNLFLKNCFPSGTKVQYWNSENKNASEAREKG